MPGKDNIVFFVSLKIKLEILRKTKECIDAAQTNFLKTQFVALLPKLKLTNKRICDVGLVDLINDLNTYGKSMHRTVKMMYKLLQVRLWYEWDNHELDGEERKLFTGPGQIIREQMSCEDTNIKLPKGLGDKIHGIMEANGELRGKERNWPYEILNIIENVALGDERFRPYRDLRDV